MHSNLSTDNKLITWGCTLLSIYSFPGNDEQNFHHLFVWMWYNLWFMELEIAEFSSIYVQWMSFLQKNVILFISLGVASNKLLNFKLYLLGHLGKIILNLEKSLRKYGEHPCNMHSKRKQIWRKIEGMLITIERWSIKNNEFMFEDFEWFSYWVRNTSVIHIWKNGSGSGFPSKNAFSSTSDLSGWENGASWAAPLTVANDKMSPYSCVQPATCFPSNQVL